MDGTIDAGARFVPERNIYDNRNIYFDRNAVRYYFIREAIEEALCNAVFTWPSENFPAVDVACGPAVFTTANALYFSKLKNKFPSNITWIATDIEKGISGSSGAFLDETIPALDFFSKDPSPQFADRKGQAVFIGDTVMLEGLSKTEFNGLKGIVTGPDTKSDGRYGVCICSGNSPGKNISLKPANITRDGRSMGDREGQTMEEATKKSVDRGIILQGLRKRAVPIDILQWQSWKSLDPLGGGCGLVTCTNLLTMIGYRNPEVWREVMRLASNLLCATGALVMYDTAEFGGYGDVNIMGMHAERNFLRLMPLELPNKLIKRVKTTDPRMSLMVWLKM